MPVPRINEKPVANFFIISDFQLTDYNEKSHKKLKMALQDLRELNDSPDALVINGDMTDDGRNESYQKLEEIMKDNFYPKNTFFTIGNHEFFKNDGNEPSINRFLAFTGLEKVYYERKIQGYPFIFLGSESWGPIGAPTKDSAVLSQEQLQWLKNSLEKHREARKPIFVFLHQPIPHTVTGSDIAYYNNGIIQDKELTDILSQYPQIIYFSGHSHWDLKLPSSFMKKEFAMVNTGAVYNTYGKDGNGHETVIDPEGCQGLYVQVFEDRVVIRGRDHLNKTWIEESEYTVKNVI